MIGDQITQSKDKEMVEDYPRHSKVMEQTEIEDGVGNVDDMELGELDLEGIEKACDNPKTGYIPSIQIAYQGSINQNQREA